jgi:hypothetical protein
MGYKNARKKQAARSNMIELLDVKLKKLDPAVCFSQAGDEVIWSRAFGPVLVPLEITQKYFK